MKVVSVELPQVLYLINNGYNYIYFYEHTTDIEGTVYFSEGIFNYLTLATLMTNTINSTLGTNNRFTVFIDSSTFKTTISNSIYSFDLLFSLNIPTFSFEKSIGFTLGYRKTKKYENKTSYTSESLFNQCPTNYLFLEINDFNYSSASRLIGLFLNNFLDKNIIAKLPYKGCCCDISSIDRCNKIFLNEQNIVSSIRNYFGPIHLQKLGIKLLNQFGEVVDLHCCDFSFTLEMEILYDL